MAQTRTTFILSDLLINAIDHELLKCCKGRCSDNLWDKKAWRCFLAWGAKTSRPKRNSELLSFLLGDAEEIGNVNSKLSQSIETYNQDFAKISRFNKVMRRNMNTLGQRVRNISATEQEFHQNLIISSVQAARSSNQIQHSTK